MGSAGTGAYGGYVAPDGNGGVVVRFGAPVARSPGGVGVAGSGPGPWPGSARDQPGGQDRPVPAPWPSSPRLWGGRGRRSPAGSALAVEQAGNRAVAEHLADRPGQQRRDRQHGELVEPLLLRHRQRVGDDDLADFGVLQDVDRRAGEHAVRGGG